jgi:hypothetical protein
LSQLAATIKGKKLFLLDASTSAPSLVTRHCTTTQAARMACSGTVFSIANTAGGEEDELAVAAVLTALLGVTIFVSADDDEELAVALALPRSLLFFLGICIKGRVWKNENLFDYSERTEQRELSKEGSKRAKKAKGP